MNSSKSSTRLSFSACTKSRGRCLLLIESSMTQSVKCVLTYFKVLSYLSVSEKEMPVSKKEVGECPVDAMMRVMDGRWKGTILWRLQDRPRRTSELKRSIPDRKSTRLNSSHSQISYAVFCLKKKKTQAVTIRPSYSAARALSA